MERALSPAAVDFWQNADPHIVLEGVIPTGVGSQAKGGISRAAGCPISRVPFAREVGILISPSVGTNPLVRPGPKPGRVVWRVERALPPAALDSWQNANPHTVLEGVIPTEAGSQAKGWISRAAHMHLTEPSSHLSADYFHLCAGCPISRAPFAREVGIFA